MGKAEGIAHSDLAEKFKRFPVPEFDRWQFKDMDWQAPEPLSAEAAARLTARAADGDAEAFGCYPVMPAEELFARFDLRGDRRHAVLCVLPRAEVRILGRTYAWPIQRAWLLDSLDPAGLEAIADWKTPRPMNQRLGPEDGIVHSGGTLYALCGHGYGDHWIGNRTLLDNAWSPGPGFSGFRILASGSADGRAFHDQYLSFTWSA